MGRSTKRRSTSNAFVPEVSAPKAIIISARVRGGSSSESPCAEYRSACSVYSLWRPSLSIRGSEREVVEG
jgi:hypothetical protein